MAKKPGSASAGEPGCRLKSPASMLTMSGLPVQVVIERGARVDGGRRVGQEERARLVDDVVGEGRSVGRQPV